MFTVDLVPHALHTLVYCFSLLWPAQASPGVCFSHCLECFGWIAWLAWRAAGVCVLRVLGLPCVRLAERPWFLIESFGCVSNQLVLLMRPRTVGRRSCCCVPLCFVRRRSPTLWRAHLGPPSGGRWEGSVLLCGALPACRWCRQLQPPAPTWAGACACCDASRLCCLPACLCLSALLCHMCGAVLQQAVVAATRGVVCALVRLACERVPAFQDLPPVLLLSCDIDSSAAAFIWAASAFVGYPGMP